MRDWINLVEGKLNSIQQAMLDRVPETGSAKINLDGSVMSTLRSLKDAGYIDMTIDSFTHRAIVSRKAAPAPVAETKGMGIDMLPAATKADILDMCLGPNGPPAFEQFWVDTHGIMSFTESYLSQFLFGDENLNKTGGGGALNVEVLQLSPDQLDNSRRSVSDLVVGQYTALRTKAPPILVRREGAEWKLVEGGHRLAAAKARGDNTVDAVDVSAFFTLSADDWADL